MIGSFAPRLGRRPDVRIALIFAALFVSMAFAVPGSAGAFDLTLGRVATDGLVALGLTLVIVQGELDLSVGSTLALASAVTIKLEHLGLVVAVLIACAVGVGVGLCNGLLVTRVRINSFIATLGTMVALRGVVFTYTGGSPVSGSNIDASLAITRKFVWFLTPRMLILIGVAILVHLFMSRTRLGRDFYAVGGNREAALAAGIPVERRIWLGFCMSGFLAALAGATLGIELATGSPVIGSDSALIAIAAVVIGGTSLLGGRGTVPGTVLGFLTIGTLATGLNLKGVSSSYQQVITGLILIGVVLADQIRGRSPRWLTRFQDTRHRPEAAALQGGERLP